MARRLMSIVQSSVGLEPKDVIFFNFKKHRFYGVVTAAGLIHNITWYNPDTKETKKVFEKRTFESLTDWTESCIQEKLDEYHTRYSAWRRVRHEKSNRPMESLYKEYQRLKLEGTPDKKLSQAEQQTMLSLRAERIIYLEKTVAERDETIAKWQAWFENTHPGEQVPIAKPQAMEHNEPEPEPKAPPVDVTIQPIVLNSPSGAYVTIQRVKQKYPQHAAQIQQLGLGGFRNMVQKFESTNKTWYPPGVKTDWFDKSASEIKQDPRSVASLVHDFFKRKK